MNEFFEHKPGFVTRVAFAVIGAHKERASWAGRDDQARIRLLALALILLCGWVLVNMAFALEIATGESVTKARNLVVAALVAGMYGVVDLALLQARWWSVGRALARERGFNPCVQSRVGAFFEWFGPLPFGAIRLGLAVAVGLFSATSFGLWFWQADINARVQADIFATNAPLRARVEADYERDLQALTAELTSIEGRISARAAVAQRAAEGTSSAAQAIRGNNFVRLDVLVRRDQDLAERITCASRSIMAEENGGVDCSGTERIAGRGNRWASATAALAQLLEERRLLTAEIERAELAITQVIDPAPVAVTDPETARRDELARRRASMLAERPAVTSALIENDPAFVRQADGLVVRMSALFEMAHDEPVVAFVVIVTDAMFILLDFSVLAIALGRGPASIYAIRQVIELETRAADEVAHGLASLARASTAAAAAEVTELEARLALIRAERTLRAEIRRAEISEEVLDAWQRDFAKAANSASPPQYDA